MDKEDLFEMAVRIVEANIRSGQFQDTLNIDTIIREQVPAAFDALLKTWLEITSKDDPIH